MSVRVERVAGVGALIVVPEDPDRGFLTLRERISKRFSNRLIGARTLPMETIEPGETHAAAWERLTTEEIQLRNLTYNPREIAQNILCRCEIRPGVVLYASVLEVSPDADVIIGSKSDEVTDLRWTRFEDVLSAPRGDLGLRPGVREVIRSYMAYMQDPLVYKPREYGYRDLYDKIPDNLFDLIETGLSLETALFQLTFAAEPFARSVLLAHSQPPPAPSSDRALAT